jgi:hypothetical protein
MTPTKGCKNSAEVCRANGWGTGTLLVGNEGYGDTTIKITAVGRGAILAVTIRQGKERDWEGIWTLSNREWREV